MSDVPAINPESYLDQPVDVVESESSEITPASGVPWVAVALAVHVLVIGVAWFIVPMAAKAQPIEVIHADTEPQTIPPEPEMEPENTDPFKEFEKVQKTESMDEQISEVVTDVTNSDPTDQPKDSLAEAESEESLDSPSPNKNNSTAAGLGGGLSGGNAGGGDGGFDFRRAGPPGGPKKEDTHVDAALLWLKDHQGVDGRWSATDFGRDSSRKGAKHTYNFEFANKGVVDGDVGWEHSVDIGLTGLSLLAFAGVGFDHKAGKYKREVRRGLKYMLKMQEPDGCFGSKQDEHFVYNHAICTMALAEIYGLSMDRALKPRLDRAVTFILNAQNPGSGWRYGIQPKRNDTSVTGWMVLALKSAKLAGATPSLTKCYDDAEKWFETVTVDVNGYPKTGYNMPGSDCARLRDAIEFDNHPSMDAIYGMSMLFMEKKDPSDRTLRSHGRAMLEDTPVWEQNKIDVYYWYYASLMLYQMDESMWDRWHPKMVSALANSQRGLRAEERGESAETLDEHGSWDPVGAWGAAGGRVYATAMGCLTLQTYRRYQKKEFAKHGKSGSND